ncbi:MAG TPA: hypothetical protein VN279_01815 [Rhodocyclaceae bacterium]|nr:hypothetical protein [Rhodocyclaceae bacterium]
MPDDQETHLPHDFVASCPEQFAPRVAAQQFRQRRIRRGDDHPAFVEQRGGVAQRTPPGRANTLLRHSAAPMAPVQLAFDQREAHPHQRIEEVVPVVRTGRHLAFGIHRLLVSALCFRGLDEAHRLFSGGFEAAPERRQQHVQPVRVRQAAGIETQHEAADRRKKCGIAQTRKVDRGQWLGPHSS